MPVESAPGWPDGEDAGDEDWHDDVIWPAETDQGVPWAGSMGPELADREAGRVAGHGRSWRPGPLVSLVAVAAVSATSITIGGNGPSVMAAVTGSTTVTGRVHSIGGIKVGDQVSAQLTQSGGGRVTATAIQYPAQQAAGGIP